MSDRQILFSAPMIRALLDGRKTQTRRALKPPYGTLEFQSDGTWKPICTKFFPGDRLWVKETWRPSISAADPWHVAVLYPHTGDVKHWGWSSDADFGDWKIPKAAATGNVTPLFMPRWASRLTLTVTDVRVQRLHDMDRGDAMAEGCPFPNMAVGPDPRDWFHQLWNSIHGPDAWDANPWVVALTFDVHRRNIDQMAQANA
ncbi:hypothetical protein KZZ08_00665 [Roseovarius mucosus]|uniref:hypothetical protein n=1 Tax=Roseovarius mucosus TaxID=215743 RepID=UPI001C5F745D|nr:hypothetical protein [Roseovarius mucosus]MBW4972108.1 hypothetical protein [Roseovarius mucosus]